VTATPSYGPENFLIAVTIIYIRKIRLIVCVRVRVRMFSLCNGKYEQRLTQTCTHIHKHGVHTLFMFTYTLGTCCTCLISGFCRIVNENFALQGCYVSLIGSYLPTFRDNVSVRSSRAELDAGKRDREVVPI
jgi:hypothetical protein